jgi:hypothetical protein
VLKSLLFGPNSKLTRMYGPQLCGIEAFVAPDSLEIFGEGVFEGCYALSSLVFGENSRLREMGAGMCTEEQNFDMAGSRIRELRVPASVEVIGMHAFSGCFFLTKLEFAPGSRLRELSGFAHVQITELDVPDSVEVIGWAAFRPCKQLRMVRFGRDSKLRKVETHFKHAFVTYSERYLKRREVFEWEGMEDEEPGYRYEANSADDEYFLQWLQERRAQQGDDDGVKDKEGSCHKEVLLC